jgi:hypothetical protein
MPGSRLRACICGCFPRSSAPPASSAAPSHLPPQRLRPPARSPATRQLCRVREMALFSAVSAAAAADAPSVLYASGQRRRIPQHSTLLSAGPFSPSRPVHYSAPCPYLLLLFACVASRDLLDSRAARFSGFPKFFTVTGAPVTTIPVKTKMYMGHLCIFVRIFKTHSKMINLRDIKFCIKQPMFLQLPPDQMSFLLFSRVFLNLRMLWIARVQNKSPSADFGDSAFLSFFNRI